KGSVHDSFVEDFVSKTLRVSLPSPGAFAVRAEVLRKAGEISIFITSVAVLQVSQKILRADQIGPEFPAVPAHKKVERIADLETVFAGIDARQILSDAEVRLSRDSDLHQAGLGGHERIIDLIGMAILEPAEPKLIDARSARAETPGQARIASAHAGVAI